MLQDVHFKTSLNYFYKFNFVFPLFFNLEFLNLQTMHEPKQKYIKNKLIYSSFHRQFHANCKIFSLSLLISSRFFCSLYFLLISWISFNVLSMSNLYSLVFAWYMLICAANSFSLLVLVVRPLWRIDSFSATYRPGCFFMI